MSCLENYTSLVFSSEEKAMNHVAVVVVGVVVSWTDPS